VIKNIPPGIRPCLAGDLKGVESFRSKTGYELRRSLVHHDPAPVGDRAADHFHIALDLFIARPRPGDRDVANRTVCMAPVPPGSGLATISILVAGSWHGKT
jgi:hypothetical protein